MKAKIKSSHAKYETLCDEFKKVINKFFKKPENTQIVYLSCQPDYVIQTGYAKNSGKRIVCYKGIVHFDDEDKNEKYNELLISVNDVVRDVMYEEGMDIIDYVYWKDECIHIGYARDNERGI